jgi:hypothetical protein
MSSCPKPILKLDWCSYEAAKYAVKHWHYSRSLPCSKTARIGVWEDSVFIGAVVFAWGANKRLAGEYGLKMTECVELCRVALTNHRTPVSKIVSFAVKTLKRTMPGIRLLVSYADPEKGHIGGIYQAMNWIYVGERATASGIMLRGKLTHRRTVNSKYGTSSITWLRQNVDRRAYHVNTKPKHKYLYPLDETISQRVRHLHNPYPKRATSKENVVPGFHPGEGGENPTVALQIQE